MPPVVSKRGGSAEQCACAMRCNKLGILLTEVLQITSPFPDSPSRQQTLKERSVLGHTDSFGQVTVCRIKRSTAPSNLKMQTGPKEFFCLVLLAIKAHSKALPKLVWFTNLCY